MLIVLAAVAASITLISIPYINSYTRNSNQMGISKSKPKVESDIEEQPLLLLLNQVRELKDNVDTSSWPNNQSRGEYECRKTLIALTSIILNLPLNHPLVQFDSIRHSRIRNPLTRRKLEIDCYNPNLRIGVEYNGKQHYERVPRFQRTESAFKRQLDRDLVKSRSCSELNIILISVHYDIKDIPSYILKRLQESGICSTQDFINRFNEE